MKQLRHHRNLFLIVIFLLAVLAGCDASAYAPTSFSAQSDTDSNPSTGDFTETASNLIVRFLDVGQADAALISCDGHHMLIDGGNKDDSRLLYSILDANSIKHLDLVIGTHADEDHIGGLPGAFSFADAGLTLCSTDVHDSDAFSDFKSYASLYGGGIRVPEVGDIFSLGNAEIEILAVNNGVQSNDTSIVLKLTHGEVSFLFTGDAEWTTEQFLLDSGTDLHSTVLKVAHHGSDDSSSLEFLQAVAPEYAIISVGSDNPYGHPASGTLKRLRETDTAIYRTDQHGTITFYSDGTTLIMTTEYEQPANASGTETKDDSASSLDTTSKAATIPDPASENGYMFNIRSKKFHRLSCESVTKMSEQNKRFFTGTRDEAIALDYSPCGICKP